MLDGRHRVAGHAVDGPETRQDDAVHGVADAAQDRGARFLEQVRLVDGKR